MGAQPTGGRRGECIKLPGKVRIPNFETDTKFRTSLNVSGGSIMQYLYFNLLFLLLGDSRSLKVLLVLFITIILTLCGEVNPWIDLST